jgi:RNA polymerase sigma factor (TIGR02999 family)
MKETQSGTGNEHMSQQGEVTRLLSEIRNGDEEAAEQLIPIVYKELRRMAASVMKNERPGHTLQPTALVHEAYMRMMEGASISPENRAHFFAIAGRSMRQVLVDHARRRLADKRGGEMQQRVELDDGFALTEQQGTEVLALHEALDRLQKLDARQAKIVEMHYFADNEVAEIAQALGIGERTVKRDLQTARLYLKRQLASQGLKLE